MASITKVIGAEMSLLNTVANTVNDATLVRLINVTTDTFATITVQAGAANVASFTLGPAGSDESVVYLKKEAAEKLLASANSVVKASKVAYA